MDLPPAACPTLDGKALKRPRNSDCAHLAQEVRQTDGVSPTIKLAVASTEVRLDSFRGRE